MPKSELYAYIKVLNEFGRRVRIKNLLAPPSRVVFEEIEQDVENLLDVFAIGLELYEQNNSIKML